jgi:uncharacterized sulfatase
MRTTDHAEDPDAQVAGIQEVGKLQTPRKWEVERKKEEGRNASGARPIRAIREIRGAALRSVTAAALVVAAGASAAERPNIVLILADDLAWSDLACYGSLWHDTPSLDRLAREGMRFTQAYAAAPICSASRAAILTGRSPARLGFEFVTKGKPGRPDLGQPLLPPPYTLDLPLEEVTMAEMLSGSGYATGFFGKWHVSRHHGGYLRWSPTHGPLRQGFAAGDADFGGHPYGYRKGEGADREVLPDGTFPPDILTDKALAWMRGTKRPFFLFLSHYFVHDPVHTRCRWLEAKVAGRLPPGAAPGRAAYGAMVGTLDHLVGRVLGALDEAGLAKDTLVVFTSDNGGHPDHAANGPLRGSKWNLYEGGIRVPLIVRWPGRVAAGSTNDTVVTGCDLFPTFAELAGAQADGVARDGTSLVPLLRDATTRLPGRPVIWHFPYYHPETGYEAAPESIGADDFVTSRTRPHSAVRLGDWKLLHFHEDGRDELYNLRNDIGEQRDLARAEPARARELRRELDAHLAAVGARMPERNPRRPGGIKETRK